MNVVDGQKVAKGPYDVSASLRRITRPYASQSFYGNLVDEQLFSSSTTWTTCT